MNLALFAWAVATFSTGAVAQCNPLTTNGCAAIPGLASSSYTVDFTKEKSLPKDWILADGSDVSFGSNGISFNFNKRKDAPYIWTNFYLAYGRVDVEMQVAAGTGVVTSAVLFSDDLDEIDWEFSGSNFGSGTNIGRVQTNVFGKGITGNYDRGTLNEVSPTPQTSFHTYTLDWTPDKIDWILDGKTIRTETNNGQKTGNYQFPQTPSRLHLGVWDAGDPDTPDGTRYWAGGLTDYSKCPYRAYVRTVRITTPNPCKAWKYPDNFSGSWADVKCTNEDIPSASASTTATSTSAKPKSTEATYSVVAGDNGYTIADKLGCTFDQLSAANPNVKWDYLDIGQKLNNPGARGLTPSSSTVSSTTSSMASSTTSPTKPATSTTTSQTSTVGSSTTSTSNLTTSTTQSKSSAMSPSTSSARTPSVTSDSSTTTPRSDFSTPTTYASSSGPRRCYQDDCYNSMTATEHITSALRFCSSYHKKTRIPAPTYLSGCAGDSIRVKSACSCLTNTYSTTTHSITSTPQTSSTRSTCTTSITHATTPSTSSTLTSSTSLKSCNTSSSTHSTIVTTNTSSSTSKTSSTPTASSSSSTTTTRTTSTKTTTTAYYGWSPWGGWKRDGKSGQHRHSFKPGRMGGGRHHA